MCAHPDVDGIFYCSMLMTCQGLTFFDDVTWNLLRCQKSMKLFHFQLVQHTHKFAIKMLMIV